jgi:hypothetical protein
LLFTTGVARIAALWRAEEDKESFSSTSSKGRSFITNFLFVSCGFPLGKVGESGGDRPPLLAFRWLERIKLLEICESAMSLPQNH